MLVTPTPYFVPYDLATDMALDDLASVSSTEELLTLQEPTESGAAPTRTTGRPQDVAGSASIESRRRLPAARLGAGPPRHRGRPSAVLGRAAPRRRAQSGPGGSALRNEPFFTNFWARLLRIDPPPGSGVDTTRPYSGRQRSYNEGERRREATCAAATEAMIEATTRLGHNLLP